MAAAAVVECRARLRAAVNRLDEEGQLPERLGEVKAAFLALCSTGGEGGGGGARRSWPTAAAPAREAMQHSEELQHKFKGILCSADSLGAMGDALAALPEKETSRQQPEAAQQQQLQQEAPSQGAAAESCQHRAEATGGVSVAVPAARDRLGSTDTRSSAKKQCLSCHQTYGGFGDVCSKCRRSGQLGAPAQCRWCHSYFQGFGVLCEDCQVRAKDAFMASP